MDSDLESFTCLWLDSAANSSENKEIQKELRQIINDFQAFDEIDPGEQRIREITEEKVLLIVSGAFGRKIVPRIHDLPQVVACYVFCQNEKANKEWSSNYSKVNGVFVQHDQLIAKIIEDQIDQTKSDDRTLISVINGNSKNLETRNAMFMWFQLFIEILLRMHHKSSDRKELIDICKNSYANDPEQIKIIDEFEKHYTPENAIWWYTRDTCFYRIINRALRVQDFDRLFSFRSFITDIAKQIQQEYENSIRTMDERDCIQLYRGQIISIDELELMKNNIGEYLSMNSFLSTSRDRSLGVTFAKNPKKRNNMRPILFEIEIDPRSRTKAFANIEKFSYYQDEGEVLITLGALFRIDKVFEDDEDEIWIARVTLASEDDFHLKEIFDHMKGKIGEDTNLDSLGKLLLRMGENEKARKCYKRMLDETQLATADAHLGLGWASLRCNAYDESLKNFEESLQIRQRILGENHASVGESYSFLGEVYRKKNNYEKALIYLKKAMTIQQNTLPDDSLDLAATYDSIANMYTTTKEYDLASNYFNKALEIRQKKLLPDHPQIAAVYNNIGWLHECEEKYSKALDYYQKAREISRKTLPPTHPHVSGAETSIQRIKTKMKH